MLRDRYDPMDLFTQVPARCLRMEPVLVRLDRLLDDDTLFARVRHDLARRHPQTLTRGRRSTPVEVILRMLVVMRLYGWSYEQTEYFVADSLVLRQFCRVYWEAVPDDTTLIRWAKLIGSETLQQLNDRAVALARQKKITRGRKLRVDTTVVATDVHYPTDSSLLVDGIRVVSRLAKRAQKTLSALGQAVEAPRELFRNRTRSAVRHARRILQISRRKNQPAEERREALQAAYTKLLEVAKRSRAQARRLVGPLTDVGACVQETRRKVGSRATRLAQELERWTLLVEQVLEQAWRRVLAGEVVPSKEKLVSLFEPHTQIIKRGKAGKEVEFGRKLWVQEVEGGIVSGFAVLPEASEDGQHLEPALQRHREQFGHAPHLLAGDRGLYSPTNVKRAEALGVARVAIPTVGKPSRVQAVKQRAGWFREGCHFRAGIEGRISTLARRFGLHRCRYQGESGMGRWVGWGIVTHNLWQIARAEAAQ
jgi:transposase, IS5 family